ncbi:MAG TPA: serine hydrolase [Thermoanaerobaculia bacterium]
MSGREVEGKWHVYPEMAAAGLWTTPRDLARVVLEMQAALAGRDTRVLTIDAARHMLRPRFETAPGEGMGLGFGVQQRGGSGYFVHSGSNQGFRATLIGSMEGGRGAVVMVNSDQGARLGMQLLMTIATEYEWPGYAQTSLRRGTIDDADATRIAGRHRLPSGEIVNIRRDGDTIEVLDLTSGWQRLYPVAGGTLARTDRATQYRLTTEGLTVIDNPSSPKPAELAATRIASEEPPSAVELLAEGRIEDAKRAFREQFAADPKPFAQAMLTRRGYNYLANRRPAEGLALLELSTEFHPTSATAWDDLAEARFLTGDTKGMIAAYETLLQYLDADASVTPEQKDKVRRNAEKRIRMMADERR